MKHLFSPHLLGKVSNHQFLYAHWKLAQWRDMLVHLAYGSLLHGKARCVPLAASLPGTRHQYQLGHPVHLFQPLEEEMRELSTSDVS